MCTYIYIYTYMYIHIYMHPIFVSLDDHVLNWKSHVEYIETGGRLFGASLRHISSLSTA